MDKVKTGYYQRTVHQIPFYKSSMIGSNILMTWNFCDRKYTHISENTERRNCNHNEIIRLDDRPICKQLSPFEDSCFSSPWMVQKVKAQYSIFQIRHLMLKRFHMF